MTDKELLELAAKAAEIEIYGYFGDDVVDCHYFDIGEDEIIKWNPLTNDADAFRLAVKLGIDIGLDPATNITSTYCNIMNERHGNEPYAATRRAIVRAAAEIGKIL